MKKRFLGLLVMVILVSTLAIGVFGSAQAGWRGFTEWISHYSAWRTEAGDACFSVRLDLPEKEFGTKYEVSVEVLDMAGNVVNEYDILKDVYLYDRNTSPFHKVYGGRYQVTSDIVKDSRVYLRGASDVEERFDYLYVKCVIDDLPKGKYDLRLTVRKQKGGFFRAQKTCRIAEIWEGSSEYTMQFSERRWEDLSCKSGTISGSDLFGDSLAEMGNLTIRDVKCCKAVKSVSMTPTGDLNFVLNDKVRDAGFEKLNGDVTFTVVSDNYRSFKYTVHFNIFDWLGQTEYVLNDIDRSVVSSGIITGKELFGDDLSKLGKVSITNVRSCMTRPRSDVERVEMYADGDLKFYFKKFGSNHISGLPVMFTVESEYFAPFEYTIVFNYKLSATTTTTIEMPSDKDVYYTDEDIAFNVRLVCSPEQEKELSNYVLAILYCRIHDDGSVQRIYEDDIWEIPFKKDAATGSYIANISQRRNLGQTYGLNGYDCLIEARLCKKKGFVPIARDTKYFTLKERFRLDVEGLRDREVLSEEDTELSFVAVLKARDRIEKDDYLKVDICKVSDVIGADEQYRFVGIYDNIACSRDAATGLYTAKVPISYTFDEDFGTGRFYVDIQFIDYSSNSMIGKRFVFFSIKPSRMANEANNAAISQEVEAYFDEEIKIEAVEPEEDLEPVEEELELEEELEPVEEDLETNEVAAAPEMMDSKEEAVKYVWEDVAEKYSENTEEQRQMRLPRQY